MQTKVLQLLSYGQQGGEEQITIATTNIKVQDVDDWQKLFRCGTDVVGSCQHIDGCPEINKCLLGLITNGDYRILIITNQTGKIIARSIIQLLFDENNNPVMHMERCYPANMSHKQKQALIECGKNRTAKLGLPLTCNTLMDVQPQLDAPLKNLHRNPGGNINSSLYSDSLLHQNVASIVPSSEYLTISAKLIYVPVHTHMYEFAIDAMAANEPKKLKSA